MQAQAQSTPASRPAVPRNRPGRAALVALAALVAVTGPATLGTPAAGAAEARYEGISADGSEAFFSTTDPLVPSDTDTKSDIYVREFNPGLGNWVTREVSIGPNGGNDAYPAQYLAADEAGDRVIFSTKERLTAADKDSAEDVYVRELGEKPKTTLVSAGDASCAGSGCGNANVDAGAPPAGVVDEGRKVFLVSDERLSSADADSSGDVYLRNLASEQTTLVSVADPACGGSCGNGPQPVVFQGASGDGTKAIFTTTERLSPADTDTEVDLYERDLDAGGGSGETKLVSTPGTCPVVATPAPPHELDCTPTTSSISSNGAHVFFETNERISAADTDSSQDVYDWSAGTAKLASIGPSGGNGSSNALLYKSSSADGGEVFFATDERLTGSDSDDGRDVYARIGGFGLEPETELVSVGDGSCLAAECDKPAELRWVAAGGAAVILNTEEPLLAEDEDAKVDVYARTLGPSGQTTLVSRPGPGCAESNPECGNGPYDASFAGASATAAHAFFVTRESLSPFDPENPFAPSDGDESYDVYDRHGGGTDLVSTGTINGNGPYDAQLVAPSENGALAFFVSEEQLTGEDADAFKDIYARSASGTMLISRGNDAELESELAPPSPLLERTDPASPNASTEPRVIGSEPVEEASIKLYTTSDCSGVPVATGSAAELAEPGIAASVAVNATTGFRATAEAEGFVSSCSASLSYTQQTPAPPGEESGGGSTPAGAPAPAEPKTPEGDPYVPPETRITFGPAFKTRLPRPVFRFLDATGQPGTRYVCKVDRRPWQSCSSPTKLKKLSHGKHLFQVTGINAAGVSQAQPSKRSFKLVSAR